MKTSKRLNDVHHGASLTKETYGCDVHRSKEDTVMKEGASRQKVIQQARKENSRNEDCLWGIVRAKLLHVNNDLAHQ